MIFQTARVIAVIVRPVSCIIKPTKIGAMVLQPRSIVWNIIFILAKASSVGEICGTQSRSITILLPSAASSENTAKVITKVANKLGFQ